MAYHSQPDDSWLPYQSTHSGFDWHACGEELSQRDDVRYILSDPTVVQTADWPDRFYTDFPNIFVVSRMRASDDARVPRIELLQFYSDCIFRSSDLRHRRDAYIRRLRQRHPLL